MAIEITADYTCWSHSCFLHIYWRYSDSDIHSKEISIRGPVSIGCAFGDRDIHYARFPGCLFDRRSRLCGGSRLISLSANLYNTETIMEPRPWNISITRRPITWSDSLVRVDVKRWEREWKRCGERFDGTSIRSHGSSNLKTMTVTVSEVSMILAIAATPGKSNHDK